jgi:hypothetical protein
MKLDIEQFLTPAQRTLAALDLPKAILDRLEIERYDNGREQGFCLRFGFFAVSFSEYRSSDDLVVYAGEGFGENGQPTEAAFKRAAFVPPGLAQAKDAAGIIAAALAAAAAQAGILKPKAKAAR